MYGLYLHILTTPDSEYGWVYDTGGEDYYYAWNVNAVSYLMPEPLMEHTYITETGHSPDEKTIDIGKQYDGWKASVVLNRQVYLFHPKCKDENGVQKVNGDMICDGCLFRYDGIVVWPDGSVVQEDCSVVRPGGDIWYPDGSIQCSGGDLISWVGLVDRCDKIPIEPCNSNPCSLGRCEYYQVSCRKLKSCFPQSCFGIELQKYL